MFAPKWAQGPHKLARFPSWDPCMTPGYWAQYFNALPSSDRCLVRSCPERKYTFVFCPPPPSVHSPHRRKPAYAALFRIRLYALILVFPACAIEVQHNNQNSPTIHCNKQSHIYHLKQSVYLLFHSNASKTQAVHKTLGSFSIDDGNGSENVSFKMNSRFFQSLSRLFQFSKNGKCRRISLELNSWGPHLSLEREKEIRPRLFTSPIKLAIRHFHVAVVQGR